MNNTEAPKRKRKAWLVVLIVAVVAVIIVTLVGTVLGRGATQATAAEAPDTLTLVRSGLSQVVASTGTVQSAYKRDVTSTLSYEIIEVYVEEGSVVAEGDALCRLDTDVEDDQLVTAPIAGTVTAVNAELGQSAGGTASMSAAYGNDTGSASPGGSLFTIQDTGNLEVTATVPEYDMVDLTVGMAVTITSDALEGVEWTGTLKSISPVATDDASNFTVVATVTSDPGRLAVGMSAKMNIIVEEKQDIYAVPYDAVVENDAGESVVYEYLSSGGSSSAAQNPEGKALREIPITMGMETDYYVEISGDELSDGMQILTDPEGRNASEDTGGFPFGNLGS